MDESGLLDSLGHVTPLGLRALAEAPYGSAPKALAEHVTACSECQERVLRGTFSSGPPRARRDRPPAWRIWAVLGALLLALLSIMVTLQKLL